MNTFMGLNVEQNTNNLETFTTDPIANDAW